MIFKFMESDAALWANHLSLSGSPHIEFQSIRVSNYKPYIPLVSFTDLRKEDSRSFH